jgi:hypothetical protein
MNPMKFVPPAIGFSNLRALSDVSYIDICHQRGEKHTGPSCASTHSCRFMPAIPGMLAIDPLAELDEAAGVAEGLDPAAAGADFAFGFSSASGPWRLAGWVLGMEAISWPGWPIAGPWAWLLPMFIPGMLV